MTDASTTKLTLQAPINSSVHVQVHDGVNYPDGEMHDFEHCDNLQHGYGTGPFFEGSPRGTVRHPSPVHSLGGSTMGRCWVPP